MLARIGSIFATAFTFTILYAADSPGSNPKARTKITTHSRLDCDEIFMNCIYEKKINIQLI
jgi:hypothetical protein